MPKLFLTSLILFVFHCFFSVDGRAQEAPNLLSPQTRDFFHTVSHYTGSVNMSIPLYTYKDKDFEIPITLSYNASGFIPSKREGPVGLNWALNAGGAVVRKVNGLPDDSSGKNEKGERVSPMGIWTGSSQNKLALLNKQDIFDLKVGQEKDGYWTANDVELTPDEFTFVAPGLSGWFYVNYDGTVKCAGNKPYVVELGGMAAQPARGTGMKYSAITITADNGYKYIFGGGDAEKEWSINYPKDTEDSIAVVTAWHLKSITAPNGRNVEYQYRTFDKTTDYLYNVYFDQSGKVDAEYTLPANEVDKWKIKNIEVITKTIYLKNIVAGLVTLTFDYAKNDRKFYDLYYVVSDLKHTNYNQENLRLNKISVLSAQKGVTDFQLKYNYLGRRSMLFNILTGAELIGERLFLTEITEQNMQPYRFTYIDTLTFPSPLTKGVDYWGFWNGKDGNKSLIPESRGVGYTIEYVGKEREPNEQFCSVGLLKNITYPTDGKTTFFYEPNRYSWLLERNPYLILSKIEGIAGGVRIAAVEHSEGKLARRVAYEYPLSGILMNWPVYALAYTERRWERIGFLSWGDVFRPVINGQADSYAANYYPGEPFIHYPEVLERQGLGQGFVKYTYSNYKTIPDSVICATKELVAIEHPIYFKSLIQLRRRPSSRYFERGLLTDMQVYDAANRLVQQKHLDYSGFEANSNEWIPAVTIGEIEASSYKIYYYPIALQRETVTQYFDQDSVVTVTDYDYHNRKDAYPVSKTTIAGDGSKLETEYRYIDGWRDNAEYAAMRKLNIRNIPVATITRKNDAVIGASLINFKTFDDINARWKIYPSEVLQLETKAALANSDDVNIDKHLKVQMTYERYDNFGNVLQQRGVDGLVVSYLFDYSGLHKLAEIVGATYEEVQKAASGMNLSVVQPDASYLQNLRDLREKLPSALVTNYTYKPLVGLSSQTDPNGITTYYEYDDLNRLKRVRDHEGRVVKEYEVHYYGD